MELSIIIVNWNSKDYLLKCLQSVYASLSDLSFEVIVIDNASFDGCGEMLARQFPVVRYIQSEENIGFAKANNLAASQSYGRNLLFLNPDTEIVRTAILRLIRSMETSPAAGVVGGRILNTDGTLQTSCVQSLPTVSNQLLGLNLLQRWFPASGLWGKAALYKDARDPVEVEGITGACLMTTRDIFEKVGRFSEDYFMYFEDMDYCLKVRRGGWRNYYVPDAIIVHHGGKSSGGQYSRFSTLLMAESGWLYFRKNDGWGSALRYRFGLGLAMLFQAPLLGALLLPNLFCQCRKHVKPALLKRWHTILWSVGLISPCKAVPTPSVQ
jgi:GT2 family glycosyltransferase